MSWIELVAQRRPQAPQGVTPPENAADWFRIENNAEDPDSTDVLVYDTIGGWFGMYADEFVRDLQAVTTPKINLRLNSPGGSVFEGIAIANAIRSHPATVTVYVDALAASIASVIALAGDRTVMMPHSQFMVHNASGACYGDATEMTKMADLLDKQSRNIAEAYAERTGRPISEWQQYMADETWFTAAEAVEAGLADEVMPMLPKKEEEPEKVPASASARMATTWDLSMYRYAGREQAPEPVVAKTPETVVNLPGFDPEAFQAQMVDMLRQTIRAEVIAIFDAVAPSHSTTVKDGTWDASAQEKRLPSPVPLATAKKMYTYWDADQVEDGAVPKSAAKLPHHFVSEDGTPGAASIAGVRNALARLPQTDGLSDAERSAAEAHLRKHLAAFKGSEDAAPDDAASPEEDVEDAKKKKLPPFLQPDEDEEEEEEEKKKTEDAADKPEPEDSWSQVIARLEESPSPSADDLFNRLKEAWL